MRSLKEALIKKHTPYKSHKSFTKSMLKNGYVVLLREMELRMYIDHETACKMYKIQKNGCPASMEDDGGFFSWGGITKGLEWNPAYPYSESLTHPWLDSLDIVSVWPVQTEPSLLDQKDLEDLTKHVDPIEINL